MNRRAYNYRLIDPDTKRTIRLPEKIGRACKEHNISVADVLKYYNEYRSFGIEANYYDGALKAIYDKKKQSR